MRFKKGMKVEVSSKKDIAMGAWLCGEIISGNGHTYSVKYGWLPITSEAVVERVPRKLLRPCPPPVEGAGNWIPDDLVEVFHNLSWKTARVVNVIDGNSFFLRILGLSEEFRIHKSCVRVRQCWQDGKWFVVGKGLENAGMPMVKRQPAIRIKLRVGDDCFPAEKTINIPKRSVVMTRTLKRGLPFDLHDLEVHPEATQKKRMIKKDGSHQHMCSVYPSPTIEKVDAVVDPREILGDNYMHSSFPIGTAECCSMDVGRRNDNFLLESAISADTNSCTSSVGSCSAMDSNVYSSPFRISAKHNNNLEDYCSDAESSCGLECEEQGCSLSSDEELGPEVHRSDLYVYCSAIEALYTSGPLSWEDEAKLTNLRYSLHISDDEHLMVLRNLISTNSGLLMS